METDGDGGMVKRKNTPMWQAAMRHSAKLPDFKSASNYGSANANHGKQQEQISNLMWQQWATEGRKMGMNIPLNDPADNHHLPLSGPMYLVWSHHGMLNSNFTMD